jgi:hypothetical protein
MIMTGKDFIDDPNSPPTDKMNENTKDLLRILCFDNMV